MTTKQDERKAANADYDAEIRRGRSGLQQGNHDYDREHYGASQNLGETQKKDLPRYDDTIDRGDVTKEKRKP